MEVARRRLFPTPEKTKRRKLSSSPEPQSSSSSSSSSSDEESSTSQVEIINIESLINLKQKPKVLVGRNSFETLINDDEFVFGNPTGKYGERLIVIDLGFTIEFDAIGFFCLNYTRYMVSTSLDNIEWINQIDYRIYPCIGKQELCFSPPQRARFIKLIANDIDYFKINSFIIGKVINAPVVVGNFMRPVTNVAIDEFCTIAGLTKRIDFEDLMRQKTFSFCAKGKFIMLYFNQPFWLNSCQIEFKDAKVGFAIQGFNSEAEWETIFEISQTKNKTTKVRIIPRPMLLLKILAKTDFWIKNFQAPLLE